jgi:hypothetical protein
MIFRGPLAGKFWLATLERAVKTFAQTLLGVLVIGTGFDDVAWGEVLSVAGVAALASVLTSVIGAGLGNDGPSLASEELVPATPPDKGIGGDAPLVNPEV